MSRKLLPWAAFGAFVVAALVVDGRGDMLRFEGAPGVGKALVWATFLGFTAYSIHCSRRENLFATIRHIARLHWGRQVGIDLYLGLFLFLGLVYAHSGLAGLLFWALPTLLFGNLATLLYVAIHFDSLLAVWSG